MPQAFWNSESQILRDEGSPHTFVSSCIPAIRSWFLTSLIVCCGTATGFYLVPLYTDLWGKPGSFLLAMSNWDGNWFKSIVYEGYRFSPSTQSSVAFFPGYPCVVRVAQWLTQLPTDMVTPVVSNLAFLGSIVLFQLYLDSGTTNEREPAVRMSQLALCIWPTSFYFRMGYSESLFLLMTLLAFIGIRRNWPLWMIALIVGATTGVRSVGVALLLPFAFILWKRSSSLRQLIQRTIFLGPLSCWGLLAFMIHLQVRFQDPLVFVQAQQHWRKIPPQSGFANVLSLVTFEPVWNVYNPWSPTVWHKLDGMPIALFSMQFWNPIYFLLSVALIVHGARKRWLTIPECLLSAGLLGIPYVMQAHCLGMMSHGRFTCVVFPMFIVLGRLMAPWPFVRKYALLSFMSAQAFYWSALFSASYCVW